MRFLFAIMLVVSWGGVAYAQTDCRSITSKGACEKNTACVWDAQANQCKVKQRYPYDPPPYPLPGDDS